jgi:hypothetical protein
LLDGWIVRVGQVKKVESENIEFYIWVKIIIELFMECILLTFWSILINLEFLNRCTDWKKKIISYFIFVCVLNFTKPSRILKYLNYLKFEKGFFSISYLFVFYDSKIIRSSLTIISKNAFISFQARKKLNVIWETFQVQNEKRICANCLTSSSVLRSLRWISLCQISRIWISLCQISLCWISLCWISLCWISLCQISLCRISLCQKP